MFVEPVGDQCRVGFPSGICMPNTLAHNQARRHFHIAQVLDERARLLNRDSFVLITMDQNRWRTLAVTWVTGESSLRIRSTSSRAVSGLLTPVLASKS